jgi:hypothetical protein
MKRSGDLTQGCHGVVSLRFFPLAVTRGNGYPTWLLKEVKNNLLNENETLGGKRNIELFIS